MQKTILLVPAMYGREMLPNADTEQKLASGSYLIATKPKKPTRHSVTQKEFEQRRREAGYKKLQVLLPEPVFNKLRARLHGEETLASLLERLLAETDNHQLSLVDAQD